MKFLLNTSFMQFWVFPIFSRKSVQYLRVRPGYVFSYLSCYAILFRKNLFLKIIKTHLPQTTKFLSFIKLSKPSSFNKTKKIVHPGQVSLVQRIVYIQHFIGITFIFHRRLINAKFVLFGFFFCCLLCISNII